MFSFVYFFILAFFIYEICFCADISFSVYRFNENRWQNFYRWFCCSEGAFLVRDNRVFNGPLGRSLCLFVCSLAPLISLTRYAVLYFAMLTLLTPFTGSLTPFTHSLTAKFKFFNVCLYYGHVSREETRLWWSLETCPDSTLRLT